jgi:hypothetical protein
VTFRFDDTQFLAFAHTVAAAAAAVAGHDWLTAVEAWRDDRLSRN